MRSLQFFARRAAPTVAPDMHENPAKIERCAHRFAQFASPIALRFERRFSRRAKWRQTRPRQSAPDRQSSSDSASFSRSPTVDQARSSPDAMAVGIVDGLEPIEIYQEVQRVSCLESSYSSEARSSSIRKKSRRFGNVPVRLSVTASFGGVRSAASRLLRSCAGQQSSFAFSALEDHPAQHQAAAKRRRRIDAMPM